MSKLRIGIAGLVMLLGLTGCKQRFVDHREYETPTQEEKSSSEPLPDVSKEKYYGITKADTGDTVVESYPDSIETNIKDTLTKEPSEGYNQ